MKKLIIILGVLLMAILTIGCQEEKPISTHDEVVELQKKRMQQMEYTTKLYQFNTVFCPKKKYWEVEEYIDSIIKIEEQKLIDSKKPNGGN